MTCRPNHDAAAAADIPSPHSGSAPDTATQTEGRSGHVATIETTQPIGMIGYIDALSSIRRRLSRREPGNITSLRERQRIALHAILASKTFSYQP